MSKKHIALVSINTFNPNLTDGGSRSTLEVMRYLRTRGAEISVLSFSTLPHYRMSKEPTSPRSGCGAPLEDRDGRFAGLRFREEEIHCDISRTSTRPAIVKRVARVLLKEEIDLLVTLGNDIHALLVSSVVGIPGVHFFSSLANVTLYQELPPVYVGLLKKRKVLTISSFLRDTVRDVLGIEAGLWYRRIDPTSESRTSVFEGRTVGFYSSGWGLKGEAIVRRLVDTMPTVDFVTVGYPLYTAAAGPCAPANLTHMGWIDSVDRFYERIDVLLVPSLVEEGFSRVVIEAAMRGIPAVANRTGGIPEAMRDSGILVDVDLDCPDIEKLAERYKAHIERLLGDRGVYESYRKKALDRAVAYREMQEINSGEIYDKYFA